MVHHVPADREGPPIENRGGNQIGTVGVRNDRVYQVPWPESVAADQPDVAVNLWTLVRSATENFGINFLDEHLDGFAHPCLSTLATSSSARSATRARRASISGDAALQPARLGTFLGRVAENADRIQFRCGEKFAEHGEIGLSLTRKAADHVAADPAAGASRRIEEINSRNDSALPKRRIRRSTRGEACWKDRSKYGTTFGVPAITSIRLGRTSAGCRYETRIQDNPSSSASSVSSRSRRRTSPRSLP